MNENKTIEGYTRDEEGNYVTNKTFKGKLDLRGCERCGQFLDFVYAEVHSFFEREGNMKFVGLKVLGLECKTCNCGFIYNGEL